jgi:hypothetical protein
MHPLLGDRMRRVAREQAREPADLGLGESRDGDEDTGHEQQDRLEDIRPDDRSQTPDDGVRTGDRSQGHDTADVAELEPGVSKQQVHRTRSDVEESGHLHDDQEQRGRRIQETGPLVVAAREVLRQREDPQLRVDGKQQIREREERERGAQLEVALRESDREADAEHPDQVVCRYVGSEDGARHTPPGKRPAREVVLLGGLLASPGDQAHRHHGEQAREEQSEIQTRQHFVAVDLFASAPQA